MAGLFLTRWLMILSIVEGEFTHDQSAEALFMPYTNSIEKA